MNSQAKKIELPLLRVFILGTLLKSAAHSRECLPTSLLLSPTQPIYHHIHITPTVNPSKKSPHRLVQRHVSWQIKIQVGNQD